MSKGFYLTKSQIKKMVDDVLIFVYKHEYNLDFAVKLSIKNNVGELDGEDWTYCFKNVIKETREKIVEIKFRENLKNIDKMIENRERIREILSADNFSEIEDLENLKAEETKISKEINDLYKKIHKLPGIEKENDKKELRYQKNKRHKDPIKNLKENNRNDKLKNKNVKELKDGQSSIFFKFK
ncbi:MAG: hypothetical protein WCY43_01755 [Patescibacteria group bacterium]|nr:hypothetical protein [Patescibacteria group bacterium]